MQKAVLSFFTVFLIFGMLLHAPLTLADENNNSGASLNSSTNVSVNSNSGRDDDEDENETEDENDDLNDSEDDDDETEDDNNKREISGMGVIQFVDIEGGCWKILSNNGRSYEPLNLAGDFKQNGLRVKFEAELSNDTVSVCNVGTLIKLKEIKKITNEMDEKNRSKFTSREIITRDGCTIKIEREIKLENGKRVEIVKRKMVCADGSKEEVKIRIENRTEDGRFRERIKYEFKGEESEIEAEEGIELEEDTNGTEYKLKARLRNGNETRIKIMPDQASQIAIERLKALNFTVELREVSSRGNVSRIVYHAKAYKDGKLVGIFKLKIKVETQIDPETGEVILTTKPWWAFFVSGEDSEQTGEVEVESETES